MTLAQAITQVRRFLASQHRRGISDGHGPINRRASATALHERHGTSLRCLGLARALILGRRSDDLVEGGTSLTRIRRTLVARA